MFCLLLLFLPFLSLSFSLHDSQNHLRTQADACQAMHQGVVRDMEQQRIKKERQLDFEMQRALEEQYRKVQSVHDGREVIDKPR
jgi:protein PET117